MKSQPSGLTQMEGPGLEAGFSGGAVRVGSDLWGQPRSKCRVGWVPL